MALAGAHDKGGRGGDKGVLAARQRRSLLAGLSSLTRLRPKPGRPAATCESFVPSGHV